MGRLSVCPFTTVTAALAVPTAVSPAHAVAVTVWAPTATLSVPEKVPPAPRARSAETPAGATCTETRVICALATCAVTATCSSSRSATGRELQAQSQSVAQIQRIASGSRQHDHEEAVRERVARDGCDDDAGAAGHGRRPGGARRACIGGEDRRDDGS